MSDKSNVPKELAAEFKGGSQKDWIFFNIDTNHLFCIAIWTLPGKTDEWVLGEFVNFYGDSLSAKKMDEMRDKGYMTMLEAQKHRADYNYVIAEHHIDIPEDVIASDYWKSLVPDLSSKVTMASPNTPIDLKEFLGEMKKLQKSIRWTNGWI